MNNINIREISQIRELFDTSDSEKILEITNMFIDQLNKLNNIPNKEYVLTTIYKNDEIPVNQKIFKYELSLDKDQIIDIPATKILSVENIRNKIVIYALIDKKDPIKYLFRILFTGEQTDDINKFTFLGTVKSKESNIAHVFYRTV